MVGLIHVAETREKALNDVKFSLDEWVQYFGDVAVIPMVPPDRKGDAAQFLMETGRAVIGTPDDAVRQIEMLQKASGGFGTYLITDANWTTFANKLRSYELVAQYVFPKFQNLNAGRTYSNTWVKQRHDDFKASAAQATQQQIDKHKAEQAALAAAKNRAAE